MLSFHKCPSVPFFLSVNYRSLTLFITLGLVCLYVQVLSFLTLYSPLSLPQSVLLSYLDFDFSFVFFFLVCCTLLLAVSFFLLICYEVF